MDNQQNHATIYLIRERQKKHKQIMNAIYNFKHSVEQNKMLDKVKEATRMQIGLRYKNSLHNHSYKFPVFQNSFDEQDDTQLTFPNNNPILYDLHSQTQIVKKSVSTKTLSLDASRRVKSLQKQHIPEQQQMVSKIKRKPLLIGKDQQQNEYLIRKNSLKDRRNRSNLKLPQLKKVPSQKKNNLQQIVGKKIYTQTSSPDSKRLAKYIKKIETTGKQLLKNQPKKFFLQQC